MIPVIAIVGRPNVGKSTLFNCFTRTRDAIVHDMPGVTRDRQYGQGQHEEQRFIVIDTGGLGEEEHDVDYLMASQAQLAIEEATRIVFLVDGQQGLTAGDEKIANYLRQSNKPVDIVVNKTDGSDPNIAVSDFYQLGLGEPTAIAAAHRRGVNSLLEYLLEDIPEEKSDVLPENPGIKIAVVGRPNVGKSTLVNRLLGEDRVVVFDLPGTTRSSIFIPYEHMGQPYTLIDTAGVRRRSKVKDTVEKFSIIKTLQAIEAADVVVLLMDATDDVVDQELRLLDFILDAGKSLVIGINKWDGLDDDQKEHIRSELRRKLHFLDFVRMHFISALHGSGVGNMYDSINEAYAAATIDMSTSQLTDILQQAIKAHQPPLIQGRRIKLRLAHPGGSKPPVIVIHGNQTNKLPKAYQRYLMNTYRKALNLKGTPVRLQLKTGDNPYKDKKNKLTPKQQKHRQRMMKKVKKNKKR